MNLYGPEHYSIIKRTILNSADQSQVHQESISINKKTSFLRISLFEEFTKKILLFSSSAATSLSTQLSTYASHRSLKSEPKAETLAAATAPPEDNRDAKFLTPNGFWSVFHSNPYFAPAPTTTTLVSKDVEFSGTSFDICEQFAA